MELEILVEEFRDAIEAAKKNRESGKLFYEFPVGQCGVTSDLLGQYLFDNGFRDIVCVNGTYYDDEERPAHTWLVVNGKIVDITGDQFKYTEEPLWNNVPVYVGSVTKFYQIFEVTPGGEKFFNGIKKSWSNYNELEEWYKIILSYL